MNILLIEPFYSGSHKQFADQLSEHSRHRIQLLTLEGKFWKWRMYGAATTLGHMFMDQQLTPDLILVTDMLDLPTFISTTRKYLNPDCPIICYFHENQLAYPWKEDSQDKAQQRDVHYGMMNYHTAMAADYNLFNSAYNMNSFYEELAVILNKMPDHKHTPYIKALRAKSCVMPLGLELNLSIRKTVQPSLAQGQAPLILWNHRWQHDKNPELFFDALDTLRIKGCTFRLAVLGESYKRMPKIFEELPERFFQELVHFGYASYEDYLRFLNEADLLPVTSGHDFFGISVMEAIHCGVRPLLPKRLAYKELYKPIENPELFYDTQKDLVEKLVHLCEDFKPRPRELYRSLTSPYDWQEIIPYYDAFFDKYSPTLESPAF